MQLNVYNLENLSTSNVEVDDSVYNKDYNQALVHQVVNSLLNNCHIGTKKQKTRAEVRGGGAKPWKQKGTGRARAGTIRSPIWRGGGKVFAASVHVSRDKINKKMYRSALSCVLSELIRQKRFVVINDEAFSDLGTCKTKHLVEKLCKFVDKKQRLLVIVDSIGKNLELAIRNLADVRLIKVDSVQPALLIGHDKIISTVASVTAMQKVLQ